MVLRNWHYVMVSRNWYYVTGTELLRNCTYSAVSNVTVQLSEKKVDGKKQSEMNVSSPDKNEEGKETEATKKPNTPNIASLMSAKSILGKWKTKAAESFERKSTGKVPFGGTKMIFAMSSKEKSDDKASIKIISSKDNR